MIFENHIGQMLSIYLYKDDQFTKYFNTYFLKLFSYIVTFILDSRRQDKRSIFWYWWSICPDLK